MLIFTYGARELLASADLRNKLAKFGDCSLDCNSGYLEVLGERQHIEPLMFQFLLLLIRHQGSIVSKGEVIENLWQGRKPTDEALRAMVKKAREALTDDARNPRYIKTIPTKGYLLIPHVELSSTIVQSWYQAHKKIVTLVSLVLILSLILMYEFLLDTNVTDENKPEVRVTKSEFGELTGNRVSAYYINGDLNNIYTKKDSLSRLNTLVVEDLGSKDQLNIAFDDVELGEFWWSQNSNRLLVMRNDGKGFFIIQFTTLHSQPSITQQNAALPDDESIIALNYAGTLAFTKNRKTGLVTLFNLSSGELSEISNLRALQFSVTDDLLSEPELETDLQDSESLESAIERNLVGDIVNVWPSPSNGQYIAIIQFKDDAKLVLLDAQQNHAVVSVKPIPSGIREGVWDKNGQKFSFSDEQGALFSYQIVQDKITSWNTGGENVNALVSDCGDSCFIVANTHGVPKLASLNNPFNSPNDYAQIIVSNRLTRSEFLPFYASNGVYFIAQSNAGYNLMFRAQDGNESIVHGFGLQNKVSEFALDPVQEIAVGLLNDRPFLLDLMTQEIRYLNITFPEVGQFTFSEEGNLIFFASSASQASGRYLYDLASNQISLINEGIKLEFALDLMTSDNNLTSSLKAKLQFDTNNNARVVFNDERPTINIGKIKNVCVSCLRVHGNHLYYIQVSLAPSLFRINLLSGEQEQLPLRVPDVIKDFSLSPNANTIVLTVRQNLQTKLMKIEGFTQVY